MHKLRNYFLFFKNIRPKQQREHNFHNKLLDHDDSLFILILSDIYKLKLIIKLTTACEMIYGPHFAMRVWLPYVSIGLATSADDSSFYLTWMSTCGWLTIALQHCRWFSKGHSPPSIRRPSSPRNLRNQMKSTWRPSQGWRRQCNPRLEIAPKFVNCL